MTGVGGGHPSTTVSGKVVRGQLLCPMPITMVDAMARSYISFSLAAAGRVSVNSEALNAV